MMVTTLTIDPEAARFAERARRGKLPDYGSVRDVPRVTVYNFGPGMELEQRGNSVAAAIIAGGLVGLACIAQSYGAVDSGVVSGAMDILGRVGPAIAATVPSYVIARTAQDLF